MLFRVVKSLAGWCGVVLCLAAFSLLAASPAGAVAGYGDVAEGRYYTEPVQWSVDNDVTGIDGNCFRPDAPVSRGDAAVYIWNMQGQPSAPAHSFVDVTDESQDAAVSWMSHNEITTGTSTTTFGPDTALNRAHLATFLWRLDGKPSAPAHPFVDVHASWQQGSVSWAADRQITTGTSPTTFDPDDTLTRAHLVTFLWRYQGKPEVTVDPATPPCDPQAAEIAAAEAEMVGLVNHLREGLGLNPLVHHSSIAAVARSWSQTMAAEDDFRHNPNYSQQYPPGWARAGENISWQSGFNSLSSAVQDSFDGLVASPGHYQNMVNPQFTHLGVGIAVDEGGGFWLTQNFAHYRSSIVEPTPTEAPD